ncbi:MAG: HAD hydrolase-like protein [Muribaculaceae bacterium]|nr:HAD hydrolase-like protein [Muribaculaceae bacterium]
MKHILAAFDLDDTLFHECDYVLSGRRAVARHFARRLGLDESGLLQAMDNCPVRGPEAFDALHKLLAPDGIAIGEIIEVYRSHKPDISLSPEAEDVLSQLQAAGINLALITDGRSIGQRLKFEALGLERFFAPEAVIISEELGADKLRPLPFRTLESLYPDAVQRFYIGDNPAKDFREARKLGWRTVMLADSTQTNIHSRNLHSVPPENRPETVLLSLTDAIPLITRNKVL